MDTGRFRMANGGRPLFQLITVNERSLENESRLACRLSRSDAVNSLMHFSPWCQLSRGSAAMMYSTGLASMPILSINAAKMRDSTSPDVSNSFNLASLGRRNTGADTVLKRLLSHNDISWLVV